MWGTKEDYPLETVVDGHVKCLVLSEDEGLLDHQTPQAMTNEYQGTIFILRKCQPLKERLPQASADESMPGGLKSASIVNIEMENVL